MNDVAFFRRHGNGNRRIAVRADAVLAVEEGSEGPGEHGSALHVGEAHPLRVNDPFEQVIRALGWSKES